MSNQLLPILMKSTIIRLAPFIYFVLRVLGFLHAAVERAPKVFFYTDLTFMGLSLGSISLFILRLLNCLNDSEDLFSPVIEQPFLGIWTKEYEQLKRVETQRTYEKHAFKKEHHLFKSLLNNPTVNLGVALHEKMHEKVSEVFEYIADSERFSNCIEDWAKELQKGGESIQSKEMYNHGPVGKALALGTWRNTQWARSMRKNDLYPSHIEGILIDLKAWSRSRRLHQDVLGI
ncbi:hypothetical protein MMC14_001596 [Varicellaria rhodocarpa]|nr:hypothetical protein [Varicellaria rhodocarpa]